MITIVYTTNNELVSYVEHEEGASVDTIYTKESFSSPLEAFERIEQLGLTMFEGIELPEKPEIIHMSKLKIRRALRTRGLEGFFDDALSVNPQAQKDWNEAVEIQSDDPLVINLIPQFAAALGVTKEQLNELLNEAKI